MSSIIDSKDLYYRNLNRRIRVAFLKGHREIVLKNVLGQRYIGGGLNHRGRIVIEGTPGQDMGAFMNGPEIIVLGNAQDGVANTMNAGKIVVRGKAGEIPGYAMRGGHVFIRGDVEYRAGIHMKEYKDQVPVLVIGGTAKDYCGEYMAGGRIVILNLGDARPSPWGISWARAFMAGRSMSGESSIRPSSASAPFSPPWRGTTSVFSRRFSRNSAAPWTWTSPPSTPPGVH